MTKNTNLVESVQRALSILETFKEGEVELSLASIASKTGYYKSTILRLIGTLEHFSYIQRTSSGNYRLGKNVFQLGTLYRNSLDIEQLVRPILQELVRTTNETAAYYVRNGTKRQCLYRVNSPRSARHHLEEGVLLPLDVGATGHVLLSFLDKKESNKKIREQGFYISLGERNPDVAAVAVPVLDSDDQIFGALSVSGLISRFDAAKRELALQELMSKSKELAKLLVKEGLSPDLSL